MSAEHESKGQSQADERTEQRAARPQYEAPRITKMSEKDVLKSFQVTSAAATWWAM